MLASQTGTQVEILAMSFPNQLPANATGKAAEDEPGIWAWPFTWGTHMELHAPEAPGFNMVQP